SSSSSSSLGSRGGIVLPPTMVTRLRMFSGIRGSISAPVRMSRHSRSMLARESGSGKASALLSFNIAACNRAALTGDGARTLSLRQAWVGLFSRCDWPDPEGQAVQPVREQMRLWVRSGLVEAVDDVLNRIAVTPGGFQQSLRRGGVLLVMSSWILPFFCAWHCRFRLHWCTPHGSLCMTHLLGLCELLHIAPFAFSRAEAPC